MNTKNWSSLATLFLATLVLLTPCVGQSPDETQESQWIDLFNGKDLEGWTPKIRGYKLGENYADTFRVTEGVLEVNYDDYEGPFAERFGHLFYKTEYSNYVIRMDYRFKGPQIQGGPGWAFRNSGIMVHGQDPATMAVDQKFPVSIEVQLLGGNGKDPRSTLNLCTPGTNVVMNGELFRPHCTSSSSQTYHGDDWVSIEVEVRGNQVIRHRVNGETVLEYQNPQLDPRDPEAKPLIVDGNVQLSGGSISLQSESHAVEFRNVQLRVLPAPKKARK